MSNETYIGHRYVPQVEGEWSINKAYEELSIVLYEGNSYTSKQKVPEGVDIKNETFWILSGNYNAQMEQLRQETTEQLVQTQSKPVGLTHRNPALFDTSFERKPLISFVSDDACIEDYTVYKPLFDAYGWVFSMAIQTSYMGGIDRFGRQIMTWEQFREMNNAGYTALAHTHTHPKLAEITPEEAEHEMALSQRILLDKGFEARHLMYPHGSMNSTVHNIANKYFLSSANVNSALNDTRTNKASINRHSILAHSLEQLTLAVDNAVLEGKWLVFYFHGYETTEYTGFLEKLKALMEYVHQKGVEVKSYDDGYDLFIRKKPKEDTVFNEYILSTEQAFDNTTPHSTIKIPNFTESFPSQYFELDLEKGAIRVNEAGLFLIEFSYLIEVEENLHVFADIQTSGIWSNEVESPKKQRTQSFMIGRKIYNKQYPSSRRVQTLNGQVVVSIDGAVNKGFYIYPTISVQGQTMTEINKIKNYDLSSHLTVTKLDS